MKIEFYKETNFKETKIGKIPKDWDIFKLENVVEKIKAGGTPLTTVKEYWNGGIPFIKIEDITSAFKYIVRTATTISRKGLENSNAWIVPENSLLLAIYGSLGEVAINRIPVATNQAILGIVSKNKIDIEFLYYWFLYFKPLWKKLAKPTTQANLTAEIVKNILVPFPTVEERETISKILSVVDLAIQKTEEIIAKTERLKKGLMQLLLTKGIGHKEFKETKIGKIPKTWRLARICDVCEQRIELIRPSEYNDKPFVGLEHVSSRSVRITNFSESFDVKSAKFRFYAGDILYGKLRPYLDKAVIADFDGICSTDFLVLRPKEDVLHEFLVYVLHSDAFIKYAVATMKGTNHPRTSWSEISKFEFGLPDRNEQQRIANILISLDKKLEIEKQRNEKLKVLKQGMMDLLLSGKVRVKVG